MNFNQKHKIITGRNCEHRRVMMNFEISKEKEMIRKMVRDFAENVIQPRAIKIDKEAKFPKDIFDQMGELGLMGIPFPEEYGGAGGIMISYDIYSVDIARVCTLSGFMFTSVVS